MAESRKRGGTRWHLASLLQSVNPAGKFAPGATRKVADFKNILWFVFRSTFRVNLMGSRKPHRLLNPSPVEPGYCMPAEWEAHEATWIAWPHNHRDWPGKFATIPWVWVEIVRHLHKSEVVSVI